MERNFFWIILNRFPVVLNNWDHFSSLWLHRSVGNIFWLEPLTHSFTHLFIHSVKIHPGPTIYQTLPSTMGTKCISSSLPCSMYYSCVNRWLHCRVLGAKEGLCPRWTPACEGSSCSTWEGDGIETWRCLSSYLRNKYWKSKYRRKTRIMYRIWGGRARHRCFRMGTECKGHIWQAHS